MIDWAPGCVGGTIGSIAVAAWPRPHWRWFASARECGTREGILQNDVASARNLTMGSLGSAEMIGDDGVVASACEHGDDSPWL
jgi:hypothetical protein